MAMVCPRKGTVVLCPLFLINRVHHQNTYTPVYLNTNYWYDIV
jgi:hypothetical protein